MRELQAIECCASDGSIELCAPRVGRFAPAVTSGDVVVGGTVLGVLRVLNSRFSVVAPHGTSGAVSCDPTTGGVAYCAPLITLREFSSGDVAKSTSTSQDDSQESGRIEVKAPIDGIFYCRPSPEDPPFASVGEELTEGQTLGLIEVMKTFNPVKLEGKGVPHRALLRRVRVKDQQEVAAGQVLFEIDPA